MKKWRNICRSLTWRWWQKQTEMFWWWRILLWKLNWIIFSLKLIYSCDKWTDLTEFNDFHCAAALSGPTLLPSCLFVQNFLTSVPQSETCFQPCLELYKLCFCLLFCTYLNVLTSFSCFNRSILRHEGWIRTLGQKFFNFYIKPDRRRSPAPAKVGFCVRQHEITEMMLSVLPEWKRCPTEAQHTHIRPRSHTPASVNDQLTSPACVVRMRKHVEFTDCSQQIHTAAR